MNDLNQGIDWPSYPTIWERYSIFEQLIINIKRVLLLNCRTIKTVSRQQWIFTYSTL